MERIGPFDITRVSEHLPRSATAPEMAKLERICSTGCPGEVCDWMSLTLWRDRRTGAVWVQASGGVAGVEMWFGPGEGAIA
jgi:hypothetical protein